MIATAIGIIIIAVAVFEIHIERNAVATMNPSTRRLGLVPTRRMICNAIRRCRPHRCIDMAMMNPPRKRKITSLPYDSATFTGERTPSTGKRTSGSRAVASRGMTPVTQRRTIRMVTAATALASGARTVGSTGIARTTKKTRIDAMMKATLLIIRNWRRNYLSVRNRIPAHLKDYNRIRAY